MKTVDTKNMDIQNCDITQNLYLGTAASKVLE